MLVYNRIVLKQVISHWRLKSEQTQNYGFFNSGQPFNNIFRRLRSKEFKYSNGITKDGFWKGVRALDNVDLCLYKGITIPKDVHEVSEESIRNEIDSILADFAIDNFIVDRAIQDGDTVNIDYVGSIDGVEFKNGSTEGKGADVTIGVTNYIEGFLEH